MITDAYAAATRSIVAVLGALNEQIATLQGQVEEHFGRHPDAEIILFQPGMGPILGARALAEFGDAPGRYADAKARKNYAGTSPITRQSGKRKVALARFVHNDRLIDALITQAFCALHASPGARAYYDKQRARGLDHHAALRHSPTGSSASCTAASRPARTTTKTPRGPTATKMNNQPLDIQAPGMSRWA